VGHVLCAPPGRVAQPRLFAKYRGNPAGAAHRGRPLLVTFLGKTRKVTCCRATPAKDFSCLLPSTTSMLGYVQLFIERHPLPMAHLSKSVTSIRIIGDDLVPDEITKLLGCTPTNSYFKGEVVRRIKTGQEVTKKSGIWLLETTDSEPENIDMQVSELLGKLTEDLAVWSNIKSRFKIDLFCGLFMEESNEGAEISSGTLKALGERGIMLSLDIYGPIQEIKENDLCPCGSGQIYGQCCKPQIKL